MSALSTRIFLFYRHVLHLNPRLFTSLCNENLLQRKRIFFLITGNNLGIRSVFFWDITRRCVVIVYRRFGTTYRSHFGDSCDFLLIHIEILEFLSDNALIKIISKNTTLRVPFRLFLPGDFGSWSGFVAFLSLCCLRILRMGVRDFPVYVTVLSVAWLIGTNCRFCLASSSYASIIFATISLSSLRIVLRRGGRHSILHFT
jgi:hypothetical protein